jgi:CRISPR-associated protein Cas2
MFEVNTGVYVGHFSARVRDELWQRVCENLRNGRATMVFSSSGEQSMDFRVHNTSWEPVDFDGLKLMRRPSPARLAQKPVSEGLSYSSKAARFNIQRHVNAAKRKQASAEGYVVIDIETTGLSAAEDAIIEMAAIKVEGGKPVAEFASLVDPEREIPRTISDMTGITDNKIAAEGRSLAEALNDFLAFVGTNRVVSHNYTYDYAFLRAACRRLGLRAFVNPCTDTLALARRKVKGVENFKLVTLGNYFSLETDNAHRALSDCYLTHYLYEKLNEI